MQTGKIKKHLLTFLRDILILVVIGNIISLFMVPMSQWSLRTVGSNCLFSIGIGYPTMAGMKYLTMVLEQRLPWLKFPVKRMVFQVLSLNLFSALVIFVGFSVWLRFMQHITWNDIMGYLLPSLKVIYIFVFLSLVFGNMILFFKNWKKATMQQEELKRAHLALQNQTLREQIRPHFLFNSLSSLVNLINTDTDKATLFVHKLSDVYRYVLDLKDEELVPLDHELKFLEDYIYLQQIRYGEKLRVEVDAGSDTDRLVVPLTLQILVENAIKHNQITTEHPLDIHIGHEAGERLVVRNKLRKKEIPADSPGTGLENLRKRIAFFTDEAMEVREDASSFMVRIPTFPKDKRP